MTHEEWEAEWRACFARLRAKGYELLQAQKMARDITRARYGPQPSKPPLWLRVTVKMLGRKPDSIRPAEEKTMKQRIVSSVIFGLAAVLSALQVSGLPTDSKGWLALGGVFIAAAWGKFSSNQTLLAPNRDVWTEEKRLNGGK